MVEMIRHCPDCGQDRPFEQCHPQDGSCPDGVDGCCPEWLCADCGVGLLIGFVPYQGQPARAERLRRLVA
jgi:hypothetical protein